jgi:aryl-alcohol dehydrogenase-like predicted oxidoreductase
MQDAFRAGTVRREEIFVATKLWNTNHRPERVKPGFDASRRRLQLDYIDCYLIHTPFAFKPGDEQNPRDERSQVIYDSGVRWWRHGGRWRASWTTVTASRSAYPTSLWRSCERSSRSRGSSLPWCRSNRIRISRNGTCSTSVASLESYYKRHDPAPQTAFPDLFPGVDELNSTARAIRSARRPPPPASG